MAKIDTSTIPNFDSLSDADKLKAIQELEIPEAFDPKKYVPKDTFDRKASEAAEYSRQLREKMTEDERMKAETEAKQKELAEKYEALLQKTEVGEIKSKCLALGIDEKLSQEAAEAYYAKDTEKFFEIIAKSKGVWEASVKEKLVRGTPPPAGKGESGEGTDSAVDFAKSLGAKRTGEKSIEERLSKFQK